MPVTVRPINIVLSTYKIYRQLSTLSTNQIVGKFPIVTSTRSYFMNPELLLHKNIKNKKKTDESKVES